MTGSRFFLQVAWMVVALFVALLVAGSGSSHFLSGLFTAWAVLVIMAGRAADKEDKERQAVIVIRERDLT